MNFRRVTDHGVRLKEYIRSPFEGEDLQLSMYGEVADDE